MNDTFKILVAYDGSPSADAALDDLGKAGFPAQGVDAEVMSVAEVWLPPMKLEGESDREFISPRLKKKFEKKIEALNEAGGFAGQAAGRVSNAFPDWSVGSWSTYGSPAWEILARASETRPDLIIVGAKGRSAVERVILGSVSQKVATEALCPVRVSRGSIEIDRSETRVMVGYDGSEGAREAVRTVVGRDWRSDTKIRVVIIEDSIFLRSSLEFEVDEIEKAGEKLVSNLSDAGLDASLVIKEGNPKHELPAEADSWGADCIFIGATKYNDICSKYLLGSVSTAVVARAGCSVEVVRPIAYDAEFLKNAAA